MPIRTPTNEDDALEWWRKTVSGQRIPHVQDDPQPGWFYLRHTKGGPRVPVRIRIEQDIDPETGELSAPERLVADIHGDRTIPARLIWERVRAISIEEYSAILSIGESNPKTMQATKAKADILSMRFAPPRRL